MDKAVVAEVAFGAATVGVGVGFGFSGAGINSSDETVLLLARAGRLLEMLVVNIWPAARLFRAGLFPANHQIPTTATTAAPASGNRKVRFFFFGARLNRYLLWLGTSG